MLTKIALSVAIVVGTASGALAATKHPAHRFHGPVVQGQVPTSAYGAYGAAAFGRPGESGANLNQRWISVANGTGPFLQW